MKYQRIGLTARLGLGLIVVAHLSGCLLTQTESAQTTHSLDSATNANKGLASVLAACQQKDSGWSLVRSFETAHYSLSLCQRGNTLFLLGQEKDVQRFVKASAQVDREMIVAESSDRFSYEIRQGTLTVKKRGEIVVQEGVN